ncbi:GtrA family protein [Methyloglobulus morosus]|uniref:GtrA family protein n=1 Tax=Methyloglobulus morosus TaxID=1410681 RepID=UPI00137B59F5
MSIVITFFKFGAVGALTAGIYFSVMWVVQAYLKFSYLIAVSAAYFISTIFHFYAHRHFTFNAVNNKQSHQAIRYLLVSAINYLLTIFVVTVCVELFGLSPYIGVCYSVFVTVITGFILSRYWTFKS